MGTKKLKRTHILLPEDLAREIDALAGRRGRSAFLVETAREAVRRRRLLNFLEKTEPAWKQADHPEMPGDSSAWVKRQRRASHKRSQSRSSRGRREPQRS
jgi:superfamily II DNA/RNA helicase